VLDKIKHWLNAQKVLTSLDFGNAARYTFANWERLTRFAHDPRIPLDNNATERGIRGPVVGRRNHFGSKSQRGTVVASILYSLAETAKLNRLSPAKYIADAVRAARRGDILPPLAKNPAGPQHNRSPASRRVRESTYAPVPARRSPRSVDLRGSTQGRVRGLPSRCP